jgi:hypothetical protein
MYLYRQQVMVLLMLLVYDVKNLYEEYWNVGKKSVRHQNFFWQSIASVQHQHSGIRVSPVPLVMD